MKGKETLYNLSGKWSSVMYIKKPKVWLFIIFMIIYNILFDK